MKWIDKIRVAIGIKFSHTFCDVDYNKFKDAVKWCELSNIPFSNSLESYFPTNRGSLSSWEFRTSFGFETITFKFNSKDDLHLFLLVWKGVLDNSSKLSRLKNAV